MSGVDPSSSRLRWVAVVVALSLALVALVVDTGAPVEAQQRGGDGNADLVSISQFEGMAALAASTATCYQNFIIH